MICLMCAHDIKLMFMFCNPLDQHQQLQRRVKMFEVPKAIGGPLHHLGVQCGYRRTGGGQIKRNSCTTVVTLYETGSRSVPANGRRSPYFGSYPIGKS